MSDVLERRQFFKALFRSATHRISADAVSQNKKGENRGEMIPDFLPDLTPELLELEAERLGLDPQKDRSLVIESVWAALNSPVG